MKFIERQKLTRLEKSIHRKLTPLIQQQQSTNSSEISKQITNLRTQLNSISLHQLYIACYPSEMKYISLFGEKKHATVDDIRVKKRRMDVWKRIREQLLQNNDVGVELETRKHWFDFDSAKKVLLEMKESSVPDISFLNGIGGGKDNPKSNETIPETNYNINHAKETTDNRFILSKDVDNMFQDSTTGNDYEDKLALSQSDSSASDDSDESSDSDDSSDNADPLREFVGAKSDAEGKSNSDQDAKQLKRIKPVNAESSSSSDESDSSDSTSETFPQTSVNPNTKNNSTTQHNKNMDNDSDESGDESTDDFFTSEKISAEEVFAQAERQHQNKSHSANDSYYSKKKSDKSKGFSTQNQTKREFRNFQHRKKRSRLG